MLFDYPPFGTVIITPEVIETFRKFQQTRPGDMEGGGYLFGELSGNQLIIKKASEPGSDDIRKRFFFKRNAIRSQKILDWLWRSSKGRMVLAGEWHSHPEPVPVPSGKDVLETQKSFKSNHFPLGFMVIAIVGNRAVVDSWIGVHSATGMHRIFRSGHILWTG